MTKKQKINTHTPQNYGPAMESAYKNTQVYGTPMKPTKPMLDKLKRGMTGKKR